MTKKFTEEQYQEIINFEDFETVYRLGLVDSFVGEIIPFISNNDLQQEALALANPLTREWAHDKFVEEEKKFLFTKIEEVEGDILSLNQLDIDAHIYLDFDDPTPLTIKQVEDYGYNLDKFTKTPYEYSISEEDDLPF